MQYAAQIVDPYGRPLHGPVATTAAMVASGAPFYAGNFNWPREPVDIRTLPARHEIYRQMAQSDAHVAEVLRSNALPLLSRAVWKLSPSTAPEKGKEPSTPAEKRAAELVSLADCNLYGRASQTHGMEYWSQTSWMQRRREQLRMLDHGFSLFHFTTKNVNGARCFDRITWLEPTTIQRWLFDAYGGLDGVDRWYVGPTGEAKTETLPAAELLLCVWDLVGMRIEGTALIRPLYGAWKRKDFFLKCKAIAAQRAAVGVPWAKWDPNAGSADDEFKDALEAFLQSTLGSGIDSAYGAFGNPTLEVEYLAQKSEDFQKFDVLSREENLAIAHGGGTKSGMLGETQRGAQSLGETQNVDKYVLVEAIGLTMAEMETRGCLNLPGPLAHLARLNYGNSEPAPTLDVSNVDPMEAVRNLPMLKEHVAAGTVKKRPALENMVLQRLGFELTESELAEEFEGPVLPPGPALSLPIDEEKRLARRLARRWALDASLRRHAVALPGVAFGTYWREPTVLEARCVSLGAVAAFFRTSSDQVTSVLKRGHRKMIDELMGRVRAGKLTRDTVGGLRRSEPKVGPTIEGELAEWYIASASQGRRDVRAELDRQHDVARASAAYAARLLAVRSVVNEAGVVAELAVDAIWNRLVSETANELERLTRGGESGAALEAQLEGFLQELTEGPISEAGRKLVNVGYADGRDIAAQEAKQTGEAAIAQRSEILDDRTCGSCREYDLMTYEIGSEEYDQYSPPYGCEGDDNCRGYNIVVADDFRGAAGL